MIARTHQGYRCGECHQRAKLTDAQVHEMRFLKLNYGWSYRKLAQHFGCGESTARDITTYRTRPIPAP